MPPPELESSTATGNDERPRRTSARSMARATMLNGSGIKRAKTRNHRKSDTRPQLSQLKKRLLSVFLASATGFHIQRAATGISPAGA